MCVEKVTIAQCAPPTSPTLSFTCGKLHMVAQDRIVCDDACGNCVCFFGTCGTIGRDIPTDGIDLSDVAKIRCASCTGREDIVGDRRKDQEILESALLMRPAVNKEAWEEHAKLLKKLWHSKSACPYHPEDKSREFKAAKAKPTTPEPAKEHVWVEVDTKPVDTKPVEASFVEVTIDKPAPVEPSDSSVSEHTEAKSAPTIDSWTGAPVTEGVTNEPAAFDSHSVKDGASTFDTDNDEPKNADEAIPMSVVQNGLDREEGIHSSRWAHQNPEVSVPSQDKGEEVQNSGLTPVTRRAVNFSFSAEQADKLREATEKFASLKSGFLSGMAA
ncbi:hypothetical protein ACLX1H_009212 [Fusarium chlamydosporum]